VFEEIRKAVSGYNVQPAGLLTGGAEATRVEFARNGHAPYDVPVGLIHSVKRHLVTSGHAWALLHHDGILAGGQDRAVISFFSNFIVRKRGTSYHHRPRLGCLLFIVLTVMPI